MRTEPKRNVMAYATAGIRMQGLRTSVKGWIKLRSVSGRGSMREKVK